MTSDRANRAPEIISRGRVEALSDGVFAIVVTLLVLEITSRIGIMRPFVEFEQVGVNTFTSDQARPLRGALENRRAKQ